MRRPSAKSMEISMFRPETAIKPQIIEGRFMAYKRPLQIELSLYHSDSEGVTVETQLVVEHSQLRKLAAFFLVTWWAGLFNRRKKSPPPIYVTRVDLDRRNPDVYVRSEGKWKLFPGTPTSVVRYILQTAELPQHKEA